MQGVYKPKIIIRRRVSFVHQSITEHFTISHIMREGGCFQNSCEGGSHKEPELAISCHFIPSFVRS